jgi:hypothetical protein
MRIQPLARSGAHDRGGIEPARSRIVHTGWLASRGLVLVSLGAVMMLPATAVGAATAARAVGASSSPPCTPKITKIQGHQAAVGCGPATATLQVGGKTYSFKNGFCQQSKSAGSALQLDLGTIVSGAKGNADQPDFSMLIGSVHSLASVFGADYHGKALLDGESLINVSGSIPSKGTFSSKFTVGAKFTGSWNCHGVVWNAP